MCPRGSQEILPGAEMSDDSDDSSDVSMSESSDSATSGSDSDSDNQQQPEASGNNEEDEEEDEVIKAIRRECEKKRDHPPPITCDDAITDICFHPFENYLVVANIVGDVTIYKYTNDENTVVNTLELHTKSCRDIEFNHDGRILLSVSKDRSIMLSNFDDGKLVRFYDNAHDVPINRLTVIDENCFATGDDDGCVKLWDLRQDSSQPIYRARKNEDYISDMVADEAKKYLLCSSGDGSLTTIDLHNRKIHMQSEEYEEELTCLGLVRTETKLLAGSANGKLFTFNWNEFGLHCDEFPVVNKISINDLIPVTENIVVVGCEDGNLRACHLFPNKHLGVVGQHDLSIENLDICNDGTLIASSSHNNDIKFWNIKYFENFEKISSNKKTNKRKDFRNNLPSSKLSNAADFFSGLCS